MRPAGHDRSECTSFRPAGLEARGPKNFHGLDDPGTTFHLNLMTTTDLTLTAFLRTYS